MFRPNTLTTLTVPKSSRTQGKKQEDHEGPVTLT